MKKNLFSFFLMISFLGFGQYTQIPDEYFEIALLDLGVDDVFDHQVLTENIAHITELDVSSSNIQDLTGIEDFLALEVLEASANNLTHLDLSNNLELRVLHLAINQLNSLDISNNSKLEYLRVHTNQLTVLDVSQNPLLYYLSCGWNLLDELDISQNPLMYSLSCQENLLSEINISHSPVLNNLILSYNEITNLDLSNNPELVQVSVSNNNLTNLDISQNPLVKYLFCNYNNLTSLNLKSRNNIQHFSFVSTNNVNLECIEVDDAVFANANWNNSETIDSWSSFSEDCNYMSTNEQDFTTFHIYPNPTKNILNFSENLKEITIYDLSGKLILKGKGDQINVSNLPSGTYLLKGITNSGKSINQKFIKN